MRGVVLLVMASACGRLGFDPTRASADADPLSVDVARDTAMIADSAIDAAPDAAPLPLMFVQKSTVATSGGGPVTPTLPAASTAGTLLVAAIATNDPTSLSLPAGWQVAVQMYTSGNCASTIVYYPDNPGGITSVVVTINGAVPTDAVLVEFQGVRTTNPIADVSGMASANNPQTSQTVATTSATTAAGDLAIAMFCEDVNNPTYTNGGGWTSLGTVVNPSSSPSVTVDYQLPVPMAVVSETVTSTIGGKYQAAIATFLKQ